MPKLRIAPNPDDALGQGADSSQKWAMVPAEAVFDDCGVRYWLRDQDLGNMSLVQPFGAPFGKMLQSILSLSAIAGH
jgi:hypothetical protein